MKTLKTPIVFILFVLCYLNSSAQNNKPPVNEPDYNKPKLFTDLPDKITFDPSQVENVFTLRVGASAKVLPMTDALFVGNVVSTSDARDRSSKTVVIKLTNRPGATLTLSKIVNADGTTTYRGRIISRTNGDAFELTKENGQYFLIKKSLYDLMNE